MTGFMVKKAGVLSLIQDQGRVGQSHLGLTQGGVADGHAYYWLNRLLDNAATAPCIEITMGGLKLKSQVAQIICVTGGACPLFINGKRKQTWCNHFVQVGDEIEIGYTQSGLRAYLGVRHGFQIPVQFGSSSTVVREGVGGINGTALKVGDKLPCRNLKQPQSATALFALGQKDIPRYEESLNLRVVIGYQYPQFSIEQQQLFFDSEFTVSNQSDRMGYRLSGPSITPPEIALASEGISYGAIQIPPDGQPIILLNDRQTLGGYPKIGSVLSLDAYRLSQCAQGTKITFSAITAEQAIDELHKQRKRDDSIQLKRVNSVTR